MYREPITPRIVAKKVVQAIVASQVSRLTAGAITNHTRFDKDDTIVEVGAGTIGWLVSEQVAPVTDKIVDKTANFINVKRAQRKERKNQKNTSEEK